MKNLTIILISLVLFGCQSNKKYKDFPIDTLLNYPNGEIISKKSSLYYLGDDGIIILRTPESNGSYSIQEVRVVYEEYMSVNVGDTVGGKIKLLRGSTIRNSKKLVKGISTIENYKNGIVIDKTVDYTFTTPLNILTIKKQDFTGNWSVYELIVKRFEYDSVEKGDTIK